MIEESTKYENFVTRESQIDDDYNTSLEKVLGEIETPIVYTKPEKEAYRRIIINIYSSQNLYDFCVAIGRNVPWKVRSIYYPEYNSSEVLFEDHEHTPKIDINLIDKPFKMSRKSKPVLEDEEWEQYWFDMPEYKSSTKKLAYRKIDVLFRKEEDVKKFAEVTNLRISGRTSYATFPQRERRNMWVVRWVEDEPLTLPKHPCYIISKNRHDSMITSKTMARMKIPHYIIIEPQDEKNYEEALDKFNIREWVTLIVAPFSNHGDGPGRARNFVWDHAISIGATWHWVFDDNIQDFYRMHNNERIRFESGAYFRAMEDFVERFENVYIAGPNYKSFVPDVEKRPAFIANTRIYSALLIRNDCPHRWRGRYNEDTDLSLRVLKDGNCTIQFNTFLQGKIATQLIKGGNTAEFYHSEGVQDKAEWRAGTLNPTGTINKSMMLVNMHPDVTTLVWRYGRWHHYVDYSGFRDNELKYREDAVLNKDVLVNEYRTHLITNYSENNQILEETEDED